MNENIEQYMTDKDGRSIKHPALINKYANLNVNKISEDPIEFIGLDLETNHKTAELMLLGFWNNGAYSYYLNDFLIHLLSYVKYAYNNNKAIAYWNRLDSFVLFKQFLLKLNDQEQKRSLEHFGKISGRWNNELKKWDVYPVVRIQLYGVEFGILSTVRSSMQFYFKSENSDKIKTVWAYDIAALYHYGLEREASSRLDYYSKVDKSAHLVDWLDFASDKKYRDDIVLKSNELDARAVHDLGLLIQEDFKNAFGFYPKTLVSHYISSCIHFYCKYY